MSHQSAELWPGFRFRSRTPRRSRVRSCGTNGSSGTSGRSARTAATSSIRPPLMAEVTDGIVTLTGAADHRYECKQAEFVARIVVGVADVDNEVELVCPVPSQLEVERSMKAALGPDAAATDIAVTASPGTVTLSGRVQSWAHRNAAIAAAAAVAAVRTVHDHLAISP